MLPVNVGVPFCSNPCKFVEVAGVLPNSRGTISGWYVAVWVIVAVSFFSFVTVAVAFTSIAGTLPV